MPHNLFAQLTEMRQELTRFLLHYQFAVRTMETKLDILNEELKTLHDYNPIEHISSRIKTPESILKKGMKRNISPSIKAIREEIRDIAGIRITCSFVKDIYALYEMLQRQADIKIVEVKDYIKKPKPNGYQSLHIILQTPIYLAEETDWVYVEIQIRTVAMDFWASLEHKIYYKYEGEVPKHIKNNLRATAAQIAQIERQMEELNKEVLHLKMENSTQTKLVSDEQWEKVKQHFIRYLQQLD